MPISGLLIIALTLTLFWYGSRFTRQSGTRKREKVVAVPKALTPTQLKARAKRDAKKQGALAAALLVTKQMFVVADLETTGLNRLDDDILEFAAVLVAPSGQIKAEFSTLVRINGKVPAGITELTGITTQEVLREGQPLPVALKGFLDFVGDKPVFFHNASFDKTFLTEAARQTGHRFLNEVYDTLPIARAVWPLLPSHKLSVLADLVGACTPSHRALSDTRTALAVLLAARTLTTRQMSPVAPGQLVPA